MKKIMFLGRFSMLFIIAFLVSCGGAQKKDAPVVKEVSVPVVKNTPVIPTGTVVSNINKQMAKIPVMGFAAYSPNFNKEQLDILNNRIFPAVKKVINTVPANHVILITGHTSKVGSSNGIISSAKILSSKRAKAVYNFLVRKGISSGKLNYTGVGSSQPSDVSNPRNAVNRRVTFKVVHK